MEKYLIGLDVGGTKIEGALFKTGQSTDSDSPEILSLSTRQHQNLSIETLAKKRIPTNRHEGYQKVVERMSSLIQEVCQDAGKKVGDVEGIGIGLPGSVHPEKQVMLNGNTGIFIGQPLADDLRNLLKINTPILCNNDASCFALAEALCGAGQSYKKECGKEIADQTSVGIILGTGCGGGLIHRGSILNGHNGGGGEIGHSTLYYDGVPCYCGRKGCAEQYLSGPAFESAYNKLIYAQIKERPGSKEIFEMADNAEPKAVALVQQYKRDLALFLTNLTNIMDPDFFVLGGGVSTQKLIYKGLEDMVSDQAFLKEAQPKIYKHVLSDSAGVIGAAILTL